MTSSTQHKINTVLFDLDGTLIDTAPDMAAALDILCDEENQTCLPFSEVRPIVSDGSIALVKLAFGDALDESTINRLKTRYLEIYQDHLSVHSQLFDEMNTLLIQLEQNDIKWGVVTNKPGWLTEPLMESLGLYQRAACIVSSDSTKNRKPHPEPMYYACELVDCKPGECVYIGDAQRDIEAGQNAGMKTIIAEYGYISDKENIEDWNADYCIQSPSEIFALL
ncbi:Similar to phosphoglycolate phosphatase, clustered with ubiquinone biosynthesis SAM-dependent O-methyltransferase [hydrothermal vent metagenome]|uniref:Similar to phosphoglycolate phosphatase, clustered with ubiquinone biosynthesis SAM-dependent O-methyltransferase n=1 Tax=hydrothermal vent metagenome TaxID=652676 RepID=A0A3B0XF02_9ZZZZ